eukprot:774710_1
MIVQRELSLQQQHQAMERYIIIYIIYCQLRDLRRLGAYAFVWYKFLHSFHLNPSSFPFSSSHLSSQHTHPYQLFLHEYIPSEPCLLLPLQFHPKPYHSLHLFPNHASSL